MCPPQGFGLSCFQEVIGNGLGFLAVDMGSACYQHLLGRPPSGTERSVIAALSAMLVMTAVMPLDLVVKRIQVGTLPLEGGAYRFVAPGVCHRSFICSKG